MAPALVLSADQFFPINSCTQNPLKLPILFPLKSKIHCSSHQKNPKKCLNWYKRSKAHVVNPCIITPDEQLPQISIKPAKDQVFRKKSGFFEKGRQEMLVLCGFGYYMNGFRGFPWLALNFHMAYNLNMDPAVLQIVQNCGNLPMVAKPLYGILSDALYIGGARRIPYVSIGVLLQALSWGSLALIPIASVACPALLAFVLLSNLGASISEVAKDALVAEYGHANKMPGLQSYAVMASSIGGILGNLFGGFFLLKTQQTKSMFLAFAALLAFQLTLSLKTSEESLNLPHMSNNDLVKKSIQQSIKKQYSDLMVAIKEESIFRPLFWVVSSILMVPILSGSLFCYQTHCLNLDPSIIGMSKVTGQLILLSLTLLYDRFGKNISLRKVAGIVQVLYASTLLLDLILVKQINLQIGIPNEVFALCFSGLAETVAQFKLLPFYVLIASLAPPGCEGSLMSFLASSLCFSSTASGFLGVGLASFLGISSGDYTLLPLGIVIQFFLALLPLRWIEYVPVSRNIPETYKKVGRSKRTRRNRRVGRVLYDFLYSYRRERESDMQR
ncbi:probable folate-biopterin transporter 9, chloroplastic [Primulina eburnea]|uniref:probable folate-biopterin transporter 9, chloroplastic n=1 Tax=Primulina eburnea TaxID=1245227 RepID=UPI003C6C2327